MLVVLLFHLRLEGASGGFLGVSLFFTLSGYLITQILLDEHRRSGTISLGTFWTRRLRRLMPGAFVALSLIIGVALVSDVFRSSSLRGDLWSALGYVANWRFMTADTSYADLFTATPSPVLHFWSLAIEEQFYFAFPLVMVALLATRRRRWVVPVGLSALWVSSVALVFFGLSENTIYYGTHTRAAELLTGALLALVVPIRALSSVNEQRAPSQRTRVIGAVTIIAFIVFVALVVTIETTDRWLYRGGLPAFSLVSAFLIIGVQIRGPLRWMAERPIAVACGQLSYGLYLFHWPIFLLLDETRTGLRGGPLHGLRLATTVSLAVISSRLIETPTRQRRLLGYQGRSAGAFLGVAIILFTAVTFTSQSSGADLAGLDAPDSVVEFGVESNEPSIRVAVLGSQPAALIDVQRALGNGDGFTIFDGTDARCPTISTPDVETSCATVAQRLATLESTAPIDIVVVGFGPQDRQSIAEQMTRYGFHIFKHVDLLVDEVLGALRNRETLFLDYGIRDPLSGELQDAGLELLTLATLQRPTNAILRDALTVISEKLEGADQRQRVMVIGDSSSFGVSAAINAVAGDQFNVLWAGRRNCPLVEVVRLRWWEGVEFDMEACPTLNPEWRNLVGSFKPHRIVIVVTIPEQSEQMYTGAPDWHLVGDPAFTAAHDAFMVEFMALLEEENIELFIFTSPRIYGGALGGAPFSQDERVAAWNAEIQKWAATWPEITLIDWAGILDSVELPAGSLRSDGVHLEQSALDRIIATEILPILDAAVRSS